MTFANPLLEDAYTTLNRECKNGNLVIDNNRLIQEVPAILKRTETKKPYVPLHDDITILEDRLSLMITAAVVENDVKDAYAQKKGISKGEVIYSLLLEAYKSEENVSTLDEVLSHEGLAKISKLTEKLKPYTSCGALPFSSIVTGEEVYEEAEAVSKPIKIFGDHGLNQRLTHLGYKNQQWVVATIARNEPTLHFSDIGEMTVYPSSAILKALEMYGIVKRWTDDIKTNKKCAIALGHLLTESSGMTALQLDQHLYQIAEGIAAIIP